jgi:chemotaxis protein CheC
MTTFTPAMSELELDALGELVNIGVSRAAASLRDMVGDEVHLSVPSVSVMSASEAARLIKAREDGPLVAIHQVFTGELQGRALLIFPETNSLELVKAITGGELPLEDIIELEQEALSETGNIILNGCLGTIGNLLHRSLQVSLPEVLRGEGKDVFSMGGSTNEGDVVLFLFIDFSLNKSAVRGYIAMLMDLPALASLRILLRDYIDREAGVMPKNHVQP